MNTTIANKPVVVTYKNFTSKFVDSRRVDVWLPDDYESNTKQQYAVLYMNDGQNAILPSVAFTGVDWGVDEAISYLRTAGKVRPTIVVAVWNSPKRYEEFMPQDPLENSSKEIQQAWKGKYKPIESNNYLRFLVEELKPFIDENYRTKPDLENTCIMGSSMGGLISWYAMCKYPTVFGKAACLSTHWPASLRMGKVPNDDLSEQLLAFLENHLPDDGKHKIYFDFGTITLDELYEPYQRKVDSIMRKTNYLPGIDWLTKKIPGGAHTEAAWRERVHIPLEFLLKE